MIIGKQKYTKDLFPYISDELIGKTIPILYGTVGTILLDCINETEDNENQLIPAVYKLPIGYSKATIIDTAFVEVDDAWQGSPQLLFTQDLEAGTLTVGRGRNANGSTRRVKLINPVGYVFTGSSIVQDIITHVFETFNGIKYNSSNYETTTFSSELANTLLSDAQIGFLITEQMDTWNLMYEISRKSGHPFRLFYSGSGKIDAKVLDYSRASKIPIPSCEIMNSGTIPIESNRQGVYASVLAKYKKNYFAGTHLELENTTYFDEVNRIYGTDAQFIDETFLVNQADASSRAGLMAQMLAQAPITASVTVAGNTDLAIYDVITIALSPDNLDASAREYIGNKDCLVLSVAPDKKMGTNTLSLLILNNRTPLDKQESVRADSYNTNERTKSSNEIIIEQLQEEIVQAGFVTMTSETAPAGTVAGQVGKYGDIFYIWNGTAWVKQESIYPQTPPILRFDMDSLKLVGGNYLSPLIDNSGNGNNSISISGVTPV